MISLRWKILLVMLVTVFIPVYMLNRSTVEGFNSFTSRAQEKTMNGHLSMITAQYETMVLESDNDPLMQEKFAALLRSYSPSIESDLLVLSPSGDLLFSSHEEGSDPAVSLSDMPEVSAALEKGYGSRWELTDDKSYVYYYIARPVIHNGRAAAVVHVTRNTGSITKAIIKLRNENNDAMLRALMIAAAASLLLSFTLTRPLRKLTRAARSYAAGNSDLDLKSNGRDEIGRLGEALTHMAAEIEQRNNYNREFVSTVVHELKTPLTAIKGAAEILETGAVMKEGAREKFLGNIQYETDRLGRMVSELNELSRLDAESIRGRKVKLPYGECVREILDRILPTFDTEKTEFIAQIAEDAGTVKIMPDRIEQVISNLLDNAFRYAPDGTAVTLSVEKTALGIITSVTDQGAGIAASNIDKVFERFFTTVPKDVRRDYGSGLGLSVVKSVIDNHGGTISVSSIPGKETTFSFTLPSKS